MSQVQMEALARQNVGGRWVILGDKFSVSEAEAVEMESIRPQLARRVKSPGVTQQAPQAVVTREMGSTEEVQSSEDQSSSEVGNRHGTEDAATPAKTITAGNRGGQRDGRYNNRSMRSRG